MAKVKKKPMIKAIEDHDLSAVEKLLEGNVSVDSDLIALAESQLSDLEQEYWDDKALYAGRNAEYSDIGQIVKLLHKAPKVRYKTLTKLPLPHYSSLEALLEDETVINTISEDLEEIEKREPEDIKNILDALKGFPKEELFNGNVLPSGYVLLGWACSYPNTKMIDVLLDFGFDPAYIAPNGHNALWHITRFAVTSNIVYLVQKGATFETWDTHYGKTILHEAVGYYKDITAPLYIAAKKCKADLDIRTKQGIFMESDYKKNKDESRELQEKNFLYYYREGRTPLMCTIFHPYAINLLLKLGANPTLRDAYGDNALDEVSSDRQSENFMKGGINKYLAKQELKGFKQLSFASIKRFKNKEYEVFKSRDIQAVKKFYKKYDSEIYTKKLVHSNKPLSNLGYHLGAAYRYMGSNKDEVIEFILDFVGKEYFEEHKTLILRDSIHFSMIKDYGEEYIRAAIHYFISKMGADIDARNEYGLTLFLYYLTYVGGSNFDMARILLDFGANINAVGENPSDKYGEQFIGQNAIMILLERGMSASRVGEDFDGDFKGSFIKRIKAFMKYLCEKGIDLEYSYNGKNVIDMTVGKSKKWREYLITLKELTHK